MITFDEAVESLMRQTGWDRAHAERAVRASDPRHMIVSAAAVATKDESILEKEEQVEVRKLAIAYGFKVYLLSQPRASKQTPGLADLWLAHTRIPLSLWWETKRQVGGVLSPAQQDFRDDCVRTNTGHGFGDRYAFVEKLLELELAVRGAGQYGIEPMRLAIQESA